MARKHDGKEGMAPGKAEDANRVAYGAKGMLQKGSEVNPGSCTKNSEPLGNPGSKPKRG
jgi:hypothetical protein